MIAYTFQKYPEIFAFQLLKNFIVTYSSNLLFTLKVAYF